jgi:hypothetical protein
VESDLSFENALLHLLNNDIDRARYSITQSDNYFVSKWSQLTQGNNSFLSTDLKHVHLELLQPNYEFNEFISQFSKPELTFNDF